jgi:hypothetical protein
MSYRLVEHYNDDIIEDSLIGECFVCYEFKIENEEIPINLNQQCYYLKTCSCNGWIHATCLNTWCLKTNKCPTCRTHMTKISKFVSVIIKNNWFLTSIYIFYLRNVVRFSRFLFVTFVIFYFIETIRFCNNIYNSSHSYIVFVPSNLYYDEYIDTCKNVIFNDYLFKMTPMCYN